MFTRSILLGVGAAASLLTINGCQLPPNNNPPTTQPAVTASEQLTPDGDRLDGPIPATHWPYSIARGGGGAVR